MKQHNNPSPQESHSSVQQKAQNILHYLQCLALNLSTISSKPQLDATIKEFQCLHHKDFESALYLDTEDLALYNALLLQITQGLRDKIFEVLMQGHICAVEYLNLYMLFAATPHLKADERFEVFIQMAQNALFGEGASDVENAMLLELLILSKILSYPHEMLQKVLKEYIGLISLLDINLPSSLAHSQFIVERFEALGVSMELFLESVRFTLQEEYYFALTPMRRRSVLNWQLHCFWNVSHFFNHPSWLTLYALWKHLFYTLLDKSYELQYLDEAMYLQFFMYHMCGNNYHHQAQWRVFCDEIDRVGASYYEKFAKTQGIYHRFESSPSRKAKKRIGILRDRLVANSPYKVEYSLLKNLLHDEEFSQEYEVRIYTMKLLEKSDDDPVVIKYYQDLGVSIVDVVSHLNLQGFYNSHLQKALAIKEAIHKDCIDILISPNNGYGISDFILASRSAKVQIYYSHGNFVYDIPQIDARITHICQNKLKLTCEGYEFLGVPVKMDDRFYNPPVPLEFIKTHRAKFPDEMKIVGTIGRLTKLDSLEYWQCVVKIMQAYPQSIYLACGNGNVRTIEEKITQCFEDSQQAYIFLKRIYFAGYVDSAIYGHLIDVWLDSFPLEQGESRIEYTAKGGIDLVMSKESQDEREKRIASWLEQWYHNDQTTKQEFYSLVTQEQLSLVAFSLEDYVSKAINLLRLSPDDLSRLKHIRARIKSIFDQYRSELGVNAFKQILKDFDNVDKE
ncbi:hypothetical protein LS68_004730 [Helicobacter sp. MIT 05-5293]|uniref:colanic acid biosynthesis glycosyltransferase WcaL n=1 Tax=Helicobacter sp. MIT 05-5293 TaxID=1548149 RepID=UPI0010FDD764|nr:colanic acid biosynthesis glycosyltransferase WcaL [Helicobacter sp. MIT 05-5293]TLD80791.1 hypothetical protein LS68_004730 [Helicobacter sp. MIT 05-5293]